MAQQQNNKTQINSEASKYVSPVKKINCYSAYDYRGTDSWKYFSLDIPREKHTSSMSQKVSRLFTFSRMNKVSQSRDKKVTPSGNPPSIISLRQTAKETTVIRL